MTQIKEQCHHLWTLLLMWDCDSEWYVKYQYGRFHAEHPTKTEPPACYSKDEAERVWHEWFRCRKN